MKLAGLQKTTLLDYPGKVAATVFTYGCNFRCPFCHNASLVKGNGTDVLTDADFFAFLDKRHGILDGVCVTGGEPLLHRDIADFIKAIKDKGFLVKLDTNGSNPRLLSELIAAHLIDYVAMDIKNSPDNYGKTAGVMNFDIQPINDSIELLMNSAIDYEFRTTVVKELHTAADILSIAQWIKGARLYALQQFIDGDDILCGTFTSYTKAEMETFQLLVKPYVDNVIIRGI
jgi:pyruvate formate lyase activating enzyme